MNGGIYSTLNFGKLLSTKATDTNGIGNPQSKQQSVGGLNPLPDNKNLTLSTLEALVNDKCYSRHKISVSYSKEHHGKGYQHFLLFLQCFKKAFLS